MKKKLETKITDLLALDSPANYMCWEDAEESILDDLTDEESEEYTNEGCSMVEEWFAANEEENLIAAGYYEAQIKYTVQ